MTFWSPLFIIVDYIFTLWHISWTWVRRLAFVSIQGVGVSGMFLCWRIARQIRNSGPAFSPSLFRSSLDIRSRTSSRVSSSLMILSIDFVFSPRFCSHCTKAGSVCPSLESVCLLLSMLTWRLLCSSLERWLAAKVWLSIWRIDIRLLCSHWVLTWIVRPAAQAVCLARVVHLCIRHYIRQP